MLLRTEEENKREIAGRLTPLLKGAAGYPGLREDAVAFWKALGYTSERTLEALDADGWGDFEEIVAAAVPGAPVRGESASADLKARVFGRVGRVAGLFQYDDDAVRAALTGQGDFFSSEGGILPSAIHSYVFLAVELTGVEALTRTDLATLTREVNRLFVMPALLLVRHPERETLTLAVQDRRLSRRAGQEDRDVLGRVTLVKDIALAADGSGGAAGESSRSPQPNRAHLEILHDLSFDELRRAHSFANFDGLHEAWRKTLDTSELNRKFYRELANWYFWARERVRFGPDASEAVRSQAVIRLITRLIFVWFLKEKGLVPEALFREETLRGLVVKFADPEASTYYKAILQNLFFATLNAEMDDTQRPRRFVRKPFQGKNPDRGKTDLWRYEALLTDPEKFKALVERVPFLNGGLFECLDGRDRAKGEITALVDGFTEDKGHAPSVIVPNELFFGEERAVNLNPVYDTKDRRYTVRGLIPLLSRYKFTVEENTPVEQEIALDPELLGRVFENLLASYNPETATTARKQTGSFYTPREIVDYMVDEALVAYLGGQVPGVGEEALRRLTGYADADRQAADYLDPEQTRALVGAINRVKILDPACGSGAFPMGALQKLVHLLQKLDPDNSLWKAQQTQAAEKIPDRKSRDAALEAIDATFADNNERDYARKLFLIENSIYGVDIQPIAVQITKLRCFISLVIDQRADEALPNLGILPLPNLETKFVAANALLPLTTDQDPLESEETSRLRRELEDTREAHFIARSMEAKAKRRAEDEALRKKLSASLQADGMRKEAADRLSAWNPYDHQASAGFFDPKRMFLMRDGFDIVVANPPYVRQERISKDKPVLKQAYPSVFNGTADLYTYFYALAVKLLKPGGTLAFISSNKWFRTGYGENLRRFIAEQCQIETIIDFGDAAVFENAIAYPLVFLARKQKPTTTPIFVPVASLGPPYPDVRRLVVEKGRRLPEKAINGAQWSVADDAATAIRQRIEARGPRLGDYLTQEIRRGVLTGLNKAFVIPGSIKDDLIAPPNEKNAEIIKPLAVGKDIRRWFVNRRDDWLIFTRRGIDIDAYPIIKKHLSEWKPELTPKPRDWDDATNGSWRGRKPGSYEWYEIQDEVAYYKLFEGPKIVTPDISPEMRFAYDDSGMYYGNTAYFIPGRDMYLLGLLNSSVLQAYYIEISSQVRGGYLRFFKQYVEQIPIAKADKAQKRAVSCFTEYVTCVSRHLQKMSTTVPRDTLLRDYFEQIINGLVYELYFPEDLHAARLKLFDLVSKTDLPDLDTIPEQERLPRLRALFETLYDTDHPLRGALFHLGSLEVVRTIEGGDAR